MKKCKGECGKELPETKEFFAFRKDRNKFRNHCRNCKNKQAKIYRIKNIDKILQYYEKNKEKICSDNKKWKIINKKKVIQQHLDYYKNNKESVLINQKNRRYRSPENALLTSARCRAKKKNLEFNLSVQDIIIPDKCPVLGISFCTNNDKKRNSSSPSLDRIDNTKGYIKGNVIVISWRANRLKNDATVEELYKIADFYKNLACVSKSFIVECNNNDKQFSDSKSCIRN